MFKYDCSLPPRCNHYHNDLSTYCVPGVLCVLSKSLRLFSLCATYLRLKVLRRPRARKGQNGTWNPEHILRKLCFKVFDSSGLCGGEGLTVALMRILSLTFFVLCFVLSFGFDVFQAPLLTLAPLPSLLPLNKERANLDFGKQENHAGS